MIFYYLKRSKSDNILKYCNQTVKHWLGAIEWALWRALLCTIITRAQAWAVLTSPTLTEISKSAKWIQMTVQAVQAVQVQTKRNDATRNEVTCSHVLTRSIFLVACKRVPKLQPPFLATPEFPTCHGFNMLQLGLQLVSPGHCWPNAVYYPKCIKMPRQGICTRLYKTRLSGCRVFSQKSHLVANYWYCTWPIGQRSKITHFNFQAFFPLLPY